MDHGHAPIGGHPCIASWNIRFQSSWAFEFPTEVLQRLLPPGLQTMEPRPGVSLLEVGHVAWEAGNLDGAWPAFDELTVTILVMPRLARNTPVPRFTFYVLNIVSNLEAFVENEHRTLRLPTEHTDLVHDYRPDPFSLDLRDGRGPILSFRNTEPSPVYEEEDFYGQFYTMDEGELHFGWFQWVGTLCEHQKQGDAGRLHNHPIFGDLDVEKHSLGCHLQLFTQPGVPCIERFFAPKRLR